MIPYTRVQGLAANSHSGLRALKDSLDNELRVTGKYTRPPSHLSKLLGISSPTRNPPHYLEQLLIAWDYGQQNNTHSLLINIPATLALILRYLDRRFIGDEEVHSICATLTNPQNFKLFSRGLSHNKDFVVSPCIRLLVEVCNANDGRYVDVLHQRREVWFFTLQQQFGWLKESDGREAEEDAQRPSVRSHAIRFLLALLRYSSPQQKSSLLAERSLITALFRGLPRTPASVAVELFRGLNAHYAQEKRILPSEKVKVWSLWTLKQISCWYDRGLHIDAGSLAAEAAHQLLTVVCSTPTCGLLREQWDLPTLHVADTPDTILVPRLTASDNVASPQHIRISVRRVQSTKPLIMFVQSLEIHKNPLEADLLVQILRTCPSLVHEWFSKAEPIPLAAKNFHLNIVHLDFLAAVIDIPIDEVTLIDLTPEALSDCVLPPAFTQKALMSMLTGKKSLIVFNVIQMLSSALQKLQEVVDLISVDPDGASEHSSSRTADSIRQKVRKQLPSLDFLSSLSHMAKKQGGLMFESIARLMQNYMVTFPEETATFSPAAWLSSYQGPTTDANTKDEVDVMGMKLGELHVLQACTSLDYHDWFRQSASRGRFCLFIQLLAAGVGDGDETFQAAVTPVLTRAADQCSAFLSGISVVPLIASLRGPQSTALHEILALLNQTVTHFASHSLRYHDELLCVSAAVDQIAGSGSISLIHVALLDQWSHFQKQTMMSESRCKDVLSWLVRFQMISTDYGEDAVVLEELSCRFLNDQGNSVGGAFAKARELPTMQNGVYKTASARFVLAEKRAPVQSTRRFVIENKITTRKEVHTTPEDTDLDARPTTLIMQLANADPGHRVDALDRLANVVEALQGQEDSTSLQRWLLLKEVIETTQTAENGEGLPTFLAAFAAEAFLVLQNPLHQMYEKINAFMNQGPTWDLQKIPLLHTVTRGPSDPTVNFYRDLGWFCTVLVKGLSKPEVRCDEQLFSRV